MRCVSVRRTNLPIAGQGSKAPAIPPKSPPSECTDPVKSAKKWSGCCPPAIYNGFRGSGLILMTRITIFAVFAFLLSSYPALAEENNSTGPVRLNSRKVAGWQSGTINRCNKRATSCGKSLATAQRTRLRSLTALRRLERLRTPSSRVYAPSLCNNVYRCPASSRSATSLDTVPRIVGTARPMACT